MAISATEARNVFTKQMIARYNELSEIEVKSFLRSYFKTIITDTKYISIEVLRGTEKVAVDILRGTEGTRNNFTKFTEKTIEPPYYNENFDMTSLDKYDRIWGSNPGDMSVGVIDSVVTQAIEKLEVLKKKIERAYELQAASVFESGIVTLKNGDNINFGRRTESKPTLTGTAVWDNADTHPGAILKTGAEFLRTKGKAQGGIYDVIFGAQAIITFLEHPKIKGMGHLLNVALADIQSPSVNAVGGVSHGVYTYGPYKFNLWSYPEFYDNEAGVSTPYIADDMIIMLPTSKTNFKMSFAGVPAILRDYTNVAFPELVTMVAADYVLDNYVDQRKKAHMFEIYSAGLTVPVELDRIFSAIVLGNQTASNE